jgi:hypothetical protein
MRLFGGNATLSLSGYRMEGRNDGRIGLHIVRRPKLMEPPTQEVTFGYGYHELRDGSRAVSGPGPDDPQSDGAGA